MTLTWISVLAVLAACLPARGAEPVPHQLKPVPIQQVIVEDEFWSAKRRVWQETTIRDAFRKFENDRGGALNNFDKVRDGKLGGHAGPPWYDGLIYEMIRGSSDFLAAHPDRVAATANPRVIRYAGAPVKGKVGIVTGGGSDANVLEAGVWRALKPGGRFVAECGGAGCVATIVTALHAALGRRGIDAQHLAPEPEKL